MTKVSEPAPKGRYKTGKRSRRVDLDKLNKRLLTILWREVEALMATSYSRKLDQAESSALINYLKLQKELRASPEADAEQW